MTQLPSTTRDGSIRSMLSLPISIEVARVSSDRAVRPIAGSSRSRDSTSLARAAPASLVQRVSRLDVNETPTDMTLSPQAARARVDVSTSRSATSMRAPADDAIDRVDLSDQERQVVARLAARDRAVRAHEEAHKAAAGDLYRSGPTYEYVTGPDGRQYAVSGAVQIDTSEGETPEETMARAARIRRSALAPVDPSSTDRAVASQASAMEARARQEHANRQAESSRRASPPLDVEG